MKLYATTTSERASKGQGGNEWIEVVLKVGSASDSRTIGVINLSYDNGDYLVLSRFEGERAQEYKIKGNKQKGESYLCQKCDFDGATAKELLEHCQDIHGTDI